MKEETKRLEDFMSGLHIAATDSFDHGGDGPNEESQPFDLILWSLCVCVGGGGQRERMEEDRHSCS
jgi:hypothetical protein